ncbi:hypothetical protein NIES4071_12330 [Calothrix sp. NIES-4071]|nr:hypothetical protein NIES4071_12330 [Calothrix sp. NIES-4071]BAZ55573.1 hypothetical protein NIES4105_12290 [Calothrix sp. NIES-4105]
MVANIELFPDDHFRTLIQFYCNQEFRVNSGQIPSGAI